MKEKMNLIILIDIYQINIHSESILIKKSKFILSILLINETNLTFFN
jgi:hypothetical protein